MLRMPDARSDNLSRQLIIIEVFHNISYDFNTIFTDII